MDLVKESLVFNCYAKLDESDRSSENDSKVYWKNGRNEVRFGPGR